MQITIIAIDVHNFIKQNLFWEDASLSAGQEFSILDWARKFRDLLTAWRLTVKRCVWRRQILIFQVYFNAVFPPRPTP